MASVIEELDSALVAMQTLKPPGVSGSKISAITALCDKNVQSESVIVQKIFTHFKKTAGTHKLGVLYVVDSVTRKWLEQAKKAGQPVSGTAADGTYAAGVNRISELLPVLMNDIIQHAPADQKEKIKKLLVIWERGTTFPASLLSSLHKKLDAAIQQDSTTPPGSPFNPLAAVNNNPGTSNDASSILQNLANIARQSKTAAPVTTSVPALDYATYLSSVQNAFKPADTPVIMGNQSATPSQAVDMRIGTAGSMAPVIPGVDIKAQSAPQYMAPTQNLLPGNSIGAAPPAAGKPGNEALQEQMMILQVFAAQGLPPDKWAETLAVVLASQAGTQNAGQNNSQHQNGNQTSDGTRNGSLAYSTRDYRDDRHDSRHSPPPRRRESGRSRSRSPGGWKGNYDQSPARIRKSPDYGDSPNRRHGDEDNHRGRGNDYGYRERSPIGHRRRGSSPPGATNNKGSDQEKWVDHDPSIEPDRIKVLSRTLFVGGVSSTEQELRNIFNRFGTVQTCVVNSEKRHGFVKMISREDAMRAREGAEKMANTNMRLRTRWGVGFGPRDCGDYDTGVSIIPLSRLTDADRKWMMCAENGGSGGRPIVAGMVVDEPDVEFGNGSSFKANPKKQANDYDSSRGSKSFRGGGGSGNGSGSRFRKSRTENENGPATSANSTPVFSNPSVPFPGFNLPNLPNGMPMFPPGFSMPGLPQPPK